MPVAAGTNNMPLNTTTELPPGGWLYSQPLADGSARAFKGMMPFGQFCSMVLAFRQANSLPGATGNQVMDDVDNFTCQRLGDDPRWCQKKTATSYPARLANLAKDAVHAATLYSSGVKTLYDWGDEGFKPVGQEEAQSRSDVCTGRTTGHSCPYNQGAAFPLTGPVAEVIKAHVEKKNRLKLSVLGEDELHACRICRCDMKLKVWVPIELIKAQMTKQVLNDFKTLYENCWINEKQYE
jgi:hypothetical protein